MSDKVTPQRVEDNILAVQFHHFVGTTLITCCITLKNGFTVTGESACANSDDFDKRLSKRLAFSKAKDKIGELLAFRICDDVTADESALDEPEENYFGVVYVINCDFGEDDE